MLTRLFHINDPIRLSAVAVVVFLVAVLFGVWGPTTYTEFQWMLLGEKMGEGNLVYKSIDDFTAPLAALFYLILSPFGRSPVTYVVFSAIIIFIQAVIFNYQLNRLNITTEKTFLPGLAYVLVASLSFDFYTLSPQLLGMTFILISIFQLIAIMRFGEVKEYTLSSGIYLGIAALFYLPFLLFFFLYLFAILFYASFDFRKFVIFFFGIWFPIILVGTFFYWKQSLFYYLSDLLFYALSIYKQMFLSTEQLLIFLAFPVLISIVTIVKTFTAKGFVNFQTSVAVIFLMWPIVSAALVLVVPQVSFWSFYSLVPVIAFFLSHFLTMVKRKVFTDGMILLFVAAIGFGLYEQRMDDALIMKPSDKVYGKVLVMTEDISYFNHPENFPATRFLRWRMSKRYFEDVSERENQVKIYLSFKRDLPDVIIDPEGHCKEMFEYIPALGALYTEESPGVYAVKPELRERL